MAHYRRSCPRDYLLSYSRRADGAAEDSVAAQAPVRLRDYRPSCSRTYSTMPGTAASICCPTSVKSERWP